MAFALLYQLYLLVFIGKSFVRTFLRLLNQCLHCISSRCGESIPRPFGSHAVADKPKQIIDFYYLKLESLDAGLEHLLVLRDRFSTNCFQVQSLLLLLLTPLILQYCILVIMV